mgnify:CR=1 FL=1
MAEIDIYFRFLSIIYESSCLIIFVLSAATFSGYPKPESVVGFTFNIAYLWLLYSIKGSKDVPFPGLAFIPLFMFFAGYMVCETDAV